jgi:hypothetical protein
MIPSSAARRNDAIKNDATGSGHNEVKATEMPVTAVVAAGNDGTATSTEAERAVQAVLAVPALLALANVTGQGGGKAALRRG